MGVSEPVKINDILLVDDNPADVRLIHEACREFELPVKLHVTLDGSEALEFCYEACSNDTLLEGSRLLIERVQAQASCRDCSCVYDLENLFSSCPACGSAASDLLSGEELRIREMEID